MTRARMACSLLGVTLLASFCSLARGQGPIFTYPAGNYSVTFTVPVAFTGPFVVTQTATGFTVSWGTAPVPPTPPTPPPAPPAPPTPLPVVPSGTHCWAVALIDPA